MKLNLLGRLSSLEKLLKVTVIGAASLGIPEDNMFCLLKKSEGVQTSCLQALGSHITLHRGTLGKPSKAHFSSPNPPAS